MCSCTELDCESVERNFPSAHAIARRFGQKGLRNSCFESGPDAAVVGRQLN